MPKVICCRLRVILLPSKNFKTHAKITVVLNLNLICNETLLLKFLLPSLPLFITGAMPAPCPTRTPVSRSAGSALTEENCPGTGLWWTIRMDSWSSLGSEHLIQGPMFAQPVTEESLKGMKPHSMLTVIKKTFGI